MEASFLLDLAGIVRCGSPLRQLSTGDLRPGKNTDDAHPVAISETGSKRIAGNSSTFTTIGEC
jgi:hypothetical protein